MSSKTKIVVLKSKELIYTAIFVVLGILLISLLIYMFSPSKDKKKGDKKSSIESTNEISDGNTKDVSVKTAPEATVIPPQDQAQNTDTTSSNEQSQNDLATTQNQPAPEATVIPPQESVSTSAAVSGNQATTTTDSKSKGSTYQSGVYSSIMNVGGQTELQLVVTVDNGRVSHLDITNLNETVTAMYPLISPSLDELNAQLDAGAALENLTSSKDNQYTTILILQAARESLIKQ